MYTMYAYSRSVSSCMRAICYELYIHRNIKVNKVFLSLFLFLNQTKERHPVSLSRHTYPSFVWKGKNVKASGYHVYIMFGLMGDSACLLPSKRELCESNLFSLCVRVCPFFNVPMQVHRYSGNCWNGALTTLTFFFGFYLLISISIFFLSPWTCNESFISLRVKGDFCGNCVIWKKYQHVVFTL